MEKALIISGGDFSPVKINTYDICIACDKGASYAQKMNIVPDYIVGDFDSLTNYDFSNFPKDKILSFPAKKDDTDTMLAIKHAITLGCKDITILCALGNRLDHTLANIQSLQFIADKGYKGRILSQNESLITLSSKETASIEKKEGFSLSLFSLSDSCKGLYINGSEYDVENITLTNTFPLGISNHFKDEKAEIRIDSGILLIVLSRIQ